MRIESPAFEDNGNIPARYTCDANRVNPPLRFIDLPQGTRSLALIMDDIDVPRSNRPDGLWNHWLLWNIPAETRGVGEGAEPPGISGHTTGGETEYQGPCPPEGEHRYVFRLYAIDTMLNLDYESTRRDGVLRAMEGHVLAMAELTGRYRRQSRAAPPGGMLAGR
jgi:Raf kinase inhibitor-like YbhB/YbcL family protein